MIDLDKIGIQPLSVVAVVCDGKLVYGCVTSPFRPFATFFDVFYTLIRP